MRRAARTDGNQAAIVADLRAMGVSVKPTHQLGQGFGDIACGWRRMNFLFEIKDPAKPPSARRLTPDETEFHEGWRGQIDVIHSAEEAMQIMREAS